MFYDKPLVKFERLLETYLAFVRGEPMVCTPDDAYRCFMRTEMDVLMLENCVLYKTDQKPLEGDSDWKKESELD